MQEYFEIESPADREENERTFAPWKPITIILVVATMLIVSLGMSHSRNAMSNTSTKSQRIMTSTSDETAPQRPDPIISQDQIRPKVTCGSTVSGTVTNGVQVFYILVAPDISSGSITVNTCGSQLDTYLYMYEGSQTNNFMWECDDCGDCGYQTVQTFSLSNSPSPILTRGQTYTIGVGSYGQSSGPYTMKITCDVQCGSVAKASITAGKRLPVLFQVPAADVSAVTMSTCQSNFNTFLYVYAGSTMTYSCDDCGSCSNRASQRFVMGSGTSVPGATGTNGLLAGSSVRVEVGGSQNAFGDVSLKVECSSAPTTSPTLRPTHPPFSFPAPSSCPGGRVRKSWHDSTVAERNLYLSGFKALRQNGKLTIFRDEHIEAGWAQVDNLVYHGNRQFVPWHRYFIWELEQQIRALGGIYACFTLPYWDWTRMADLPVRNNPMFTQGLGGNGANASYRCVQTGQFREGLYQTSTGGCLERQFEASSEMYNTLQSAMLAVERVQPFDNFVVELEGWHNNAHVSIGGTLASIASATDDPIFFMLHAFVDMIWAMRSDCHNYADEQSQNNYPNPSDPMSYPVLRQHAWALTNGRSLAARHFLQISAMGYTYHASNMRARSGLAMAVCSWNTIQHSPPMLVENDVRWSVSVDGPDNSYQSDARKAKRACLRLQRRAVRRGYRRRICRYKEPLEKCPPGKGRLNISLKELLNKRGVRGNRCIEAVRRRNYNFAKQLGTLRGLCNGKSDPVC